MTDPSRRAARLGLTALGTLAFFFLFGVQVPLFFPHLARPVPSDLANYLAGARVGLHAGWSRIYDPALQAPEYMALTGAHAFAWFDLFVSPPPVAWLVVPLTPLGLDAAYWTWNAIGLGALLAAAWRCSPWTGGGRVVALLVGFSLYPVLIALQFGQVTPLVAGGVGLAWAALRSGRQTWAGLLLVLVALKPQVGVFVPVALLLAGYRRCFLVWLAGAGALALVSLASLGPAGVQQLLADLAEEQRHLDNQVWTLAWLAGSGPLATAAEVACVAAGLAAAYLAGRRVGPELAMVSGSLASLLGAGYHHSIDFPAVLVLGLLQLRSLGGWAGAVFVIAGVGASVAIPRLGPGPMLVILVAWLALVAARAVAARALPAPAAQPALGAPLPAQDRT